MAAWIKSHQTLKRHPKLIGLAADLGIQPEHAIGHLHALWYDVLDYAEDGDITKFGPAVVAGWAGWRGDAVVFWAALIRHGWVDDVGGSHLVHDWHDYAGELLRRRDRQREYRAKRSRDATVASPSRSRADIEKRREDKTREEKRTPKRAALTPEQLADIYAEVLPELKQPPRPLAKTAKEKVRQAIDRDGDDAAAWRAYFESVRSMPFLMGRKSDWRAGLLWLIGPKNRAKVEGGDYLDEMFGAPSAPSVAVPTAEDHEADGGWD